MNSNNKKTPLEAYFSSFRDNIIGIDQEFDSPFGRKKIVYADWTASARLYKPIEEKIMCEFGPFVANTHTETTTSGTTMTLAYHRAKEIIKKHVNASSNDIFIASGTGMTGAINKLQRILGLKIPENLQDCINIPQEKKPIVFISHMEHHSNQTSWLETIAEVIVIPPCKEGLICLESFVELLEKHKNHPFKIVAVTACSNVTGIETPYHKIAKLTHQYNGVCFVDFACSAPYVKVNMHPDEESYLDAIFFSPHKFLGGPGTSGILIFNKKLHKNLIPDHPGGGTVSWTNPWGQHKYIDSIEEREDGGTPGFLQVIKTALCVQLKEQMNVEKMFEREHEILRYVFKELQQIANLTILAGQHEVRLGVISFYIEELHYNLGVKLLNDRFGIQTRGGCSCAGTYGHYLLHVDRETSKYLTDKISKGILSEKPGWIRMSIHPTTTNQEVEYIVQSIKGLSQNHQQWSKDYRYDSNTNEFTHKKATSFEKNIVNKWFGEDE